MIYDPTGLGMRVPPNPARDSMTYDPGSPVGPATPSHRPTEPTSIRATMTFDTEPLRLDNPLARRTTLIDDSGPPPQG